MVCIKWKSMHSELVSVNEKIQVKGAGEIANQILQGNAIYSDIEENGGFYFAGILASKKKYS